MERPFPASRPICSEVQDMSTSQKEKNSLWMSAIKEHYRSKTVGCGACRPNRYI